MILISDKGQQKGKHTAKENYWKDHGIEVLTMPLPCGDYIIANERVMDVINRKNERGVPVKKMDFLGTYNVTVDTKKDIQELVGDICGKQHARFRDECILAQNNGIKLYVLVQNAGGLVKGTKAVHNAWWEEKKKQGVTDHPDMIPYSELSEEVKEYDRVTARATIEAFNYMTHSFIYINTTGLQTENPYAPKNKVPWIPSQTDMLAEDWVFTE